MRTRVKICGVTSPADAATAAGAGADAVGLVFYSGSRRYVAPETACEIIEATGAFVTTVALFLDADRADVASVLERVRPDCLQFHGSETASFCESFGLPYIKGLGMSGESDLRARVAEHPGARAVLVDSHQPGEAGGTGATFAWSRLPEDLGAPVVLAGGLRPENVVEAVHTARPWAVDVSSGVERAPGVKDSDKIAAFMQGVESGQGY